MQALRWTFVSGVRKDSHLIKAICKDVNSVTVRPASESFGVASALQVQAGRKAASKTKEARYQVLVGCAVPHKPRGVALRTRKEASPGSRFRHPRENRG